MPRLPDLGYPGDLWAWYQVGACGVKDAQVAPTVSEAVWGMGVAVSTRRASVPVDVATHEGVGASFVANAAFWRFASVRFEQETVRW